MRDKRFLFKFDNCTLEKSYFNHQGHLRVAWLNLSNYDFDHAMIRITEGIFRYAKSLGAEHIYHETLTRVWVHLVYHAMSIIEADNFDEFIAKNEYLLDKALPLQSYSFALLDSDFAKKHWVDPDLRPLYRHHLNMK